MKYGEGVVEFEPMDSVAKKIGSPEQSSDGLKKPVRYQRPNRFSTTYFRTTKKLNIYRLLVHDKIMQSFYTS